MAASSAMISFGAGATILASAKRPKCWSLSLAGSGCDCGPPWASVENTTSSPCGTDRQRGLAMGCQEHGRQRPRSLVSRPQQSSLYWALKCILQITRSAILVPIVLAPLLEPPCTDPYARWCGRGGAARLPPIPIACSVRPFLSPVLNEQQLHHGCVRNGRTELS